MQINNLSNVYKVKETPAPAKVGEITSVVVKERQSNQEAVVVLKGSEQTVKFDGPVPANDRAMVEVVKNDKDGIVLKTVTPPAKQASSVDDLLQKAGYSPAANKDLKEVATMLAKNGTPITKDLLNTVNQFIKSDPGTIQQKTDMIKVLLQKNLDITPINLRAVNQALNGEPLTDTLANIAKKLDVSFQPQTGKEYSVYQKNKNASDQRAQLIQILNEMNQNLHNEKTQGKLNEIVKALKANDLSPKTLAQIKELLTELPDNLVRKMDLAALLQTNASGIEQSNIFNEKKSTEPTTNPNQLDQKFAQAAASLLKSVQQEASITTILDHVNDFLTNQAANKHDLAPLQAAYDKASRFSDQGRELAARRELSNALSQLEQKLPQLNSNQSDNTLSNAEQYLLNDTIQSLNLGSKNIEVTRISKRLSQMAIDFKQIKRDMTKSLDTISTMMETNKPNKPHLKQMLDATIQKLDKTILKSDMMLYTDMSQEKKLLTASSKLAEAKSLLDKGEFSQANKIVSEVKDALGKMMFKPSDVKVKHFVADQSEPKTLTSQLEQMVRQASNAEPTARHIFDMVRSLGLTHESEIAQSLLTGDGQQKLDQNLKSALMQIKESSFFGAQQADQALTNLTGQQLLAKQDTSGMQNMLLNLPFLINKQVENVKVYVNSQKNGDKIDWENCSLYFVLETKKLGTMGILLSAQNRNLTLTFKTDKDQLQEKVGTLTEISKERLKEVGYHLGAIHVNKNSADKASLPETAPKSATPTFTVKGYDFTI